MFDKKDPAAGLFTVDCECGTTFVVEDIVCPSCKRMKGKLKLNIEEMLNRVYDLYIQDKDDRAMDVIFDVFWNLYNNFDIMNDILTKVDLTKIDEGLMLGFMTNTFKYSNQVSAYTEFCARVIARMRKIGRSEKDIHAMTQGLFDATDFWKDMDALGAPEWLTGPRPQ